MPSKKAALPPAESLWDLFYAVIRKIPRGKVATYGAVAEWAGKPRSARHVGFSLAAPRSGRPGVPWQRVLGVRGKGYAAVSIRDPIGAAIQRQILEREGVRFDERDRVSLARSGWSGPRKSRAGTR